MRSRSSCGNGFVLDAEARWRGLHTNWRVRRRSSRTTYGADRGEGRLPVDGYYPAHRLVIEYREVQHDRPVGHFDRPDRMTVSGVHRGEQRKLYDERASNRSPRKIPDFVVIGVEDLSSDSRGRLRRDRESDLRTLRRLSPSGLKCTERRFRSTRATGQVSQNRERRVPPG